MSIELKSKMVVPGRTRQPLNQDDGSLDLWLPVADRMSDISFDMGIDMV